MPEFTIGDEKGIIEESDDDSEQLEEVVEYEDEEENEIGVYRRTSSATNCVHRILGMK